MELRCIRLRLKIIWGLVALLPGAGWAMPPLQGAMPPVQRAMPPVQRAADIHPALWSEQPPAFARDPVREARIGQLLGEMTLEQKVGQRIQADIGSITPDDLRHYPLGSILNGGSSSPGNNEFSAPSEWLALAERFYEASMDPAHGPRPIPTMWGTDAVHRHNNLVGATIFPHNIRLGAAHDPELIRSIGDATAQFLDAAHVIATAKHYMGDGGTVLIKNQNHLLPLNHHQHVLVAGDGANNIGKHSGGWTMTWQGTGVANTDFPHGATIYAGIQSAVTGARMEAITEPFEINSTGPFELSVTNIQLETGTDALVSCGSGPT